MKALICSYMTPQASHRFSFFHKVKGDFYYFVASELCENFPYDFSVSKLKNKCIKAARIVKPDWLIMLSGIDSSIQRLPNLNKLNSQTLYMGCRLFGSNPKKCSNWILSKDIYENYLLDEDFDCYGWEDFDFEYNVCKNFDKQILYDYLTVDYIDDSEDKKLIFASDYAKHKWDANKNLFFKKYKFLYGKEFDFEQHNLLK